MRGSQETIRNYEKEPVRNSGVDKYRIMKIALDILNS